MAFLYPIDFLLCKALTSQITCSFLFHFVKATRVRSRCSYHNRYHHHCHCLFFQVLVNFLAFLCEYPAISGYCHINNDDNLTPSVSSLFFFYVWSFDPRLIFKPNYYMLAGVFSWRCIILNIPGSLYDLSIPRGCRRTRDNREKQIVVTFLVSTLSLLATIEPLTIRCGFLP